MDLDPDRLQAAFEQAPQAIALVDVGDLTVLALNRAARALV
ncbi:PAS domain-containing protein, partial [Nocardioides aquiterrae]